MVEEQASRSVLKIAGIRLPQLLVCMFGTFISASVIRFFQVTLSQAIALAAFIPALMAMSGSSGLQTSSLGYKTPEEWTEDAYKI